MNDLSYWEAMLCTMLGVICGGITVVSWNKDNFAILPIVCVLGLVECISFFKRYRGGKE